jgi:hypothetical protein
LCSKHAVCVISRVASRTGGGDKEAWIFGESERESERARETVTETETETETETDRYGSLGRISTQAVCWNS